MTQARSKRRVRDAIVVGVGLVFLSTAGTGCFGRFRAMNAVYDFNKSASSNGIVRSLLMWAMIIIPVYGVTFLVDALVLNVLDFFNGGGVAQNQTLPDGSQLKMARLDGDSVRVRHIDPSGHETSFDVVRVGENAGYVRAADGRIVGQVERLPDGRLVQQAP
jgi:hypothetical protein